MLQILWFEKTQSALIYYMVSGIYSFIAKVYDVMLNLAGRGSEAGSIQNFYLSNMTTAMYTLAGIFMLFRVTVSAVNMIINPDMVSDRNAGAGKILTRIVTSLIMLIMFWPSGWIFGDDGVLIRLEKALLADNGLINNLIPENIAKSEGSKSNKEDLFIDNVYAADNTVDCYYFYKEATQTHMEQGQSINDTGHSKPRVDGDKGLLHIRFWNYPYDPNSSGDRKALCTKSKDCGKYSYTIVIDDRNTYKNDFLNSGKSLYASHYANGWDAVLSESGKPKCPHIITKPSLFGHYDATTGNSNSWKTEKSGIVGGWHSQSAMMNALKEGGAVVVGSSDTAGSVESALGLQNETEWRHDALNNDARDSDSVGLSVDNEAASEFAQMSMGSFMSCTDEEMCEGLRAGALVDPEIDDAIVDGMADKSVNMDWLPAIVAGIGILIWVVYLCVEVIIRRFKLLLLQMIAPIPIISYSDPNDKVFGQWAKMYAATYVDLFLKLIAIGFGTSLLSMLWAMEDDMSNLIEKFFYIVAILIFAKMIPTMISKIFGIDSMGGSFKDVVGMGKSALGFGAGAAIGGVVGAATGTGLGRIGGFTKGALLGAGSGSKGNLTGGAKSVAATNALKKQGLNWFDRMRYQGLGALGIDPNISERQTLAQIDQARTQIETLQGHIDSMDKMIGRTPEVAAFSRKITNGVIQDPTGNKEKAFKEAFARAYENSNQKTLNFSDIEKTASYQKLVELDPDAAGVFKQEYNDTYGEGADLQISGGFRAGFMTAKSAAVNSISLLRQDKETVALLGNEQISGKGEDGKLSKTGEILLKNTYDMDTTYDEFMNDVRGATFGPQGELNNLKARESQKLNFADKKTKTIK